MNRRQQLKIWLLGLDKYELRLRGMIAKRRNAYIQAASNAYELHGFIPTWLLVAHRSKVADLLQSHYQIVIPYFGSLALRNVKSRRIEKKDTQNLFSIYMQEWVRTHALNKSALITSTDNEDVLSAISAGLENGSGVAEIARAIREKTSLTPYRAATVARTETHNAATFGSVETARTAETELGIVLEKEWIATRDNRTRPEHVAADGQRTDLSGRFTVGGESLDRPGDASASPENIINCRCAIAFEEKE